MADKQSEIEKKLREKFTEEQMCAYFLTKTIRRQYQFDDAFIANWYEDVFKKKPEIKANARRELVQAYTSMLIGENKYKNHLDYWIEQHQEKLISEMESFFGGEPGK